MSLNQKTSFCSDIKLKNSHIKFFKDLKKHHQTQLKNQLNNIELSSMNIVSFARYLSLEKSIAEKKLCALNVINEKSKYIIKIRLNKKEQTAFLTSLKTEIDKFQNELVQRETLNLNDWSILESLLNHYHTIRTKKIFMSNLEKKVFQPEKIALFDKNLQIEDKTFLRKNKDYTKKVLKNYSKKVKKLYRFDLFNGNCSTEIFANLHKIYTPKEMKEIFGDVIKSKLNFIPVIASYNIKKKFKKHEKTVIESYRKATLKKLYKNNKSKFVTYLKESNTISSSLYKYNPNDGFFLFFTDDKVWTRPIYGIFNLSTSLIYSTYGIIKLPFDRGHTLKKGLLHSFYSFPELAFFNVRKGSFPHLKKEE